MWSECALHRSAAVVWTASKRSSRLVLAVDATSLLVAGYGAFHDSIDTAAAVRFCVLAGLSVGYVVTCRAAGRPTSLAVSQARNVDVVSVLDVSRSGAASHYFDGCSRCCAVSAVVDRRVRQPGGRHHSQICLQRRSNAAHVRIRAASVRRITLTSTATWRLPRWRLPSLSDLHLRQHGMTAVVIYARQASGS